MEKFKRLKRELKHNAHIFDLYEEELLMPDGRIAKWDLIDHKGAAAVVPVQDDGKILMISQYRNAVDRITLEIPAGGRNGKDEPGIECAARELEEETGFRSEDLEFLFTLVPTIAYDNERIDIFVARNLKPSSQNLDPDEFINVKAYTVEELKELIFTGKIEDSKTISGILGYASKYL